jgi:uncharacterized delta-60 repeat protein
MKTGSRKRASVLFFTVLMAAILIVCSGCGGGSNSDGGAAYTSDSAGGTQTTQTTQATASVDGKVTDENGNVVQDAVITWDVQGYCENLETPGSHPDVTSATTGSSGDFTLQGVPVGKRVIYAFNKTMMGAVEADVSPDKQKWYGLIPLTMHIGVLSGKITGKSGEPVKLAEIYWKHSNPLYQRITQSSPIDGSYKFWMIPINTSYISVSPLYPSNYQSISNKVVTPELTLQNPNVTMDIVLEVTPNPTPTQTSTSTPTPTVSPTASPTPTSGGGGGGGGDTPATKTFIALGTFNKYNDGSDHACKYMARIKTDGTFDSTFNSSGTGGNNTIIYAMEQNDGKIMIGGRMTKYNDGTDHNCGRIARLSKNGAFDNTFNNSGSGFDNEVSGIFVQNDGKYLVRGLFTSYNDGGDNTCGRFARLKTDGTFDTTFNDGGSGFDDIIVSIPVQSEGKYLLGGNFTKYNDKNGDHAAGRFIRLNEDGTYDNTFNAGGGTGFNEQVLNFGLQNDGKLIVFGYFTKYNDKDGDHNCAGLARLNADGTYDTTFNAGGTGFSIDGGGAFVNGLTMLDDGSYLVGGNFTSYKDAGVIHNCKYLARIKSDGTYDDTFAESAFNAFCQGLVIPSENKIITIGSFTKYGAYNCGGIAKLNADGTYDTTFNSTGTGFDAQPNWYVMQSGGKILTFGNFTKYNDGKDHTCGGIGRLNSNGSYDTTFNAYGTGFDGIVWTLFYF